MADAGSILSRIKDEEIDWVGLAELPIAKHLHEPLWVLGSFLAREAGAARRPLVRVLDAENVTGLGLDV